MRLWNYGLIHRDVSYGNVKVDRHGDGILIDYNLAVKKARTVEETTLPYISRILLIPETESVVPERWPDIECVFFFCGVPQGFSHSRFWGMSGSRKKHGGVPCH
ncbi:BZ3500_MvSof-1268-A1-R1_Chr1-2g01301 [Microbotryum saponariae]|uniref:BZ3500_MvSof-1268-A1-R1_Chr1-2g01301 protein n=1 Tax=Microbotryum saponariae TaxID=289078 RepID=A0A2X0KSZ3_9BASI|nr:BZ3500_MvSof-1268-A1-R1_Chr1-2g01301 [Microbotryum saponariae]SCZ97022.1 BZ3501_MvSof-1269-A2-R1_Chr1-2g00899 [Microbotryum saponariae]